MIKTIVVEIKIMIKTIVVEIKIMIKTIVVKIKIMIKTIVVEIKIMIIVVEIDHLIALYNYFRLDMSFGHIFTNKVQYTCQVCTATS